MLVLGVDPGSIVTGYGLVEKKNDQITCINAGTIASSSSIPFYERIHNIFRSMVEIMGRYSPDEMAIEDVFYAKNVKSSLKIGHARGAVLIAAVQCGIRIFEYSPLEIKKSVVGYGRASKEQVRFMARMILNLKTLPVLDASDALATAICHLNWTRYDNGGSNGPNHPGGRQRGIS
jgi:crossover junction endodeoxyribonuclease RuvC